MYKFEKAEKIGLRSKETGKLMVVYPFKAVGTDPEIDSTVRNWYYKQTEKAEEALRHAFVDVLTDTELKNHK